MDMIAVQGVGGGGRPFLLNNVLDTNGEGVSPPTVGTFGILGTKYRFFVHY